MRKLFGTIFVAACSCAAAAETITADVAVVGGGSAGFAAAWSAATLGSSVVLIEKEKVLGGTSTIGGVNNWEPVWGATGVPWRVYERLRRIPKAAGVYEFAHHCSWPEAGGGPVFPGGLLTTNPDLPYEKTLRRHGPGMSDEAWFRENCHGVIFEPEAMERTMLAMLQETGRCRVLFSAVFHDVVRTGLAADALTLADGRTVRAKVVVDACGAVCAKMGCEIMRGHEAKSAFNEPGAPDQANDNVNGATLIYRITPRKDGQEEYHVPPPGVPTACWWGGFPYAFCCECLGGDIGINMLPTISGAQLKNLDEASAMRECRRRVHAHWRWMQNRWPDFRKYRLKEIAPVLARRETWRVRGEYVLNQNDLIVGMDGQTHDDVIALADHPMDSHGGGGPSGELKAPYGIPYRCLLPKGTSNVLIAGRCGSFSSIAASSCRLSRTMMQLGEAAGVAAHLSVTRGIPLREVPAADIRTTMERRLDSLHAAPASRFVECETFTDYGGWVVDPHSMKRMGSSYLMAHGYGTPVKDATRIVNFAEAGRYTVHVRTRDWSAEWRKGRGTPPGRFQVLVNGQPVGDAVLGTNGGEWAWQRAGEVDLPVGDATVALHDLTGFNARCDVVYFSKDPDDVPPNDARELEAYRPKKRHFSTVTDKTSYDLIVVGGGISGMCVAQSAARLGVRVLLLQDRGVLGGCNSSEIRVSLGGLIHQPPYPALGNLVEEFAPAYGGNKTYPAEWYEDTRKESVFRRTTQSCTLKFNEHVFAVEMDKAQTNRICAVVSRNTRTGHETRFRATLFCDATGDAVLARLAGCETMYGREARARFNESCAPEKPVRQVMGHSVQWYAARTDAPVSFPDIDWGLPVTENSCYYVRTGDWEQEAGQYRDMADDTEAIRDYGLLSIFSNWSFLKNRSARKAEFANDRIEWVSPIGGKRESYRVVGDHALTQNDIEDHVAYPDLTAAITWNIDLHFPDPENEAKFEEPFRSCAYHRHYGRPYAVPYRCLYARDCANLFLAGRHVSCSHVAFAAVRVMRTLGMLGEVAGMAAAVCKKHSCLPRDVYVGHLDELKGLMRKGVPKLGVYHSGGCSGDNEFYHFKDTGHFPIWPKPRPMPPRVRDAIEKIGLRHRHEPKMKD